MNKQSQKLPKTSWRSPISTPPVTCWGAWRNPSWETIAAGSPWLKTTAGYLRGDSERAQYWWHTLSQRPCPWSTTHCTANISGKTFWSKKYNLWHSAASKAAKTNKEMMQRRERGSTVCLVFICFCFYLKQILKKKRA